jgi:hypothetical protein
MVAALAVSALGATLAACATTTPGQAVLASPGWGAESTRTSTESTRSTASTSTRSTAPTTSSRPTTSTPTTADLPDDAITAAFGSTVRWTDGLSVSVSSPEAFTPSTGAVGGEDATAHVRVTVTVVNNSAVVWDPGYSRLSAISDGQDVEEVFDRANGLTGLPYTQVLPGRQVQFGYGYAPADVDDLAVVVAPGYDHQEGVFSAGSSGPDGVAEAGEPSTEDLPTVEPFGDAFEWNNDLRITVSAPSPYTPTDSAVGGEGAPAAVRLEVTVTNGSDAEYDPAEFFATAQSGSAEAEEIYDGAGGLDGAPYTTVPPGGSITFPIGFGVTDPADLVVQISPGFDYDVALFTS